LPVGDAQGIVTMITTCPGCRTAFRVTQEQLAAREGRVRCGKCATIFDAREVLQTKLAELAPESGDQPEDQLPHTKAVAFPEPEPVTPRETNPMFPIAEAERAGRRAGWVTGSTLLVLALMTQIAFHYRGEIALLFPEIRPVLAELCTSLGCDVPLPRRAELISIESSDLQADPVNPGVMVLTATLRNRAAFAQSHPSLELTLTDSQDQPLARRVLAVQNYLERSTSVEAGFPSNSELPVKVYMEASSLKATGYRLYLFFP
jgi:predicted Zn finger-like uncharacterized protein